MKLIYTIPNKLWWIHDVLDKDTYKIIHNSIIKERNDIKFFDYTPAGQMGTDELTNYMKRLTPGEFLKKINKKDKVAK